MRVCRELAGGPEPEELSSLERSKSSGSCLSVGSSGWMWEEGEWLSTK